MSSVVREVEPADRELLGRLMELYLHDLSEFDGRDLGADGSYHYPWLDAYGDRSDRRAYLLEQDGHPAGFALVRLTDPVEVAEFFVVRKHRRGGIGTAFARDLIARHPGRWAISRIAGNAPAAAFWRRAIPVPFREHEGADGRVRQVFEVR